MTYIWLVFKIVRLFNVLTSTKNQQYNITQLSQDK